MKLKLKHLRSFLNTLDVPTTTCKDKRDLAELVVKNRIKIAKMQTQNPPQQQQESHDNNQQQHSHTAFNNGQQNSNSNPNTFNDRFTGFMNNVQDFVNFNLNSVLTNPPVPCPAPPQPSTSNQYNGHSSQAQGNSNSSKQPTANTTYTTNTSSSSSSLPNNLNSVFSFIGEQLPNVINNNLFTFNTNNINSSGI